MTGTLYVALFGYIFFEVLDLSYNWLMVVCCIPILLGFILFNIFLPESPRYLFIKRDFEKLQNTLKQIQRVNRTTSTTIERIDLVVKKNFAEKNLAENENIFVEEKMKLIENEKRTRSFSSQMAGFFDEKNRRMFILQLIIWFTLCFGFLFLFFYYIFF